jgi:hypothetical protein
LRGAERRSNLCTEIATSAFGLLAMTTVYVLIIN